MKFSLKGFSIVLRKELKDFFRDKKTIFSMLLPLLLYPILFYILNLAMGGLISGAESATIAVLNEDKTVVSASDSRMDTVRNALKDSDVIISSTEYDDYYAAIEDGNIDLLIVLPQSMDLEDDKNVAIIYNPSSTTGAVIASFVSERFDAYYYTLVEEKLDISIGEEKHLELELVGYNEFFGKSGGTTNAMLWIALPMMVTVLLMTGGMNVAIDLVAGEKERNTFEPLLTTSASRLGILSAKYVVVVIFAVMSVLLQLVGFALSLLVAPDMLAMASMGTGGGLGLSMSFGGTLMVLVNLFLLAIMCSGVLLILSSTAKSFKEASTKCSSILIIPVIANMAVMYQEAAKIPLWEMAIPVLNVTNTLKMVAVGRMDYGYFALALGVNLLFVVLSVIATLFTFTREKLIGRT